MCTLYEIMRSRAEIASLFGGIADRNGNAPPMPGVHPNYDAPVVLKADDGQRIIRDLKWGMPSSAYAQIEAAKKRGAALDKKGVPYDFQDLLRLEPDRGTTNIRNTTSEKTGKINAHWAPYLGPANRCLVPFSAFSEPDQVGGTLKPIWFALDEARPLAFFAGVWKASHTCVRKIKDGPTTCDVYGFLTTTANAEVAAFHKKAMPVILTTEAERDLWMSDAPWEEVQHLQRPLPDGALQLVAPPAKAVEAVPALL